MLPLLRTIVGLVIGTLGARLLGLLGRFQQSGGHATPIEKRVATRRTFTRNAALGAVGVVLAEIAAGFIYFVWPNKTGAFGGTINVGKASIPAKMAAPYRNVDGKFYIVHNDDGLLALYWRCVHLGCTVPWVESEKHFHCPCHGSIYDYNGVRIAGPAPRPLDLMAVSVDANGNVAVNTGKRTQRSSYTKSQAVPYPF